MRKYSILLLSLLLLMFVRTVEAETTLSVEEASIATSVESLMPAGVADKFPPSVGKVYCYSKIVGGGEGSSIKHIWHRGDEKVAEVPLSIKSPSFRTYSSKNILPEWTGKWKVEIAADDGTVLKTLEFTIE